jgi:hypothetical protein
MNHRLSFLAIVSIPLAAACVQAFDSNLTSGGALNSTLADAARPPMSQGGMGPGPDGGATSGQDGEASLPESASPAPDSGSMPRQDGGGGSAGEGGVGLPVCQNGNIIDPAPNPVFCVDDQPSGQIIVTQTPGIELPDASTTINPCDLTTTQSWAIRQTYCGACHEGNNNPNAPFHNILDDADGGLLRTKSITTKDDAGGFVSLIVPGDPDNSYFYKRVMTGSMPPDPASVAIAPSPKPNISEIGILYSWIANCIAPLPAPADAGAAPADAGAAPADAGAGG